MFLHILCYDIIRKVGDIMKKIVIFGGGSGLSQLLKGLKLFPIDVTAVVTVADNGGSTKRLRKEFNIPAVGDIGKVLCAMADMDQDMTNLMSYRFTASKTLGNHSIKNLILTALLDLKGDFAHAIPVFCELLDIKGKVLPLTEDNVELVGLTDTGAAVIGEESITKTEKKVTRITYNKPFEVNKEIFKALDEADLVVFSSGSLFTSILPHLAAPSLADAVSKCKAPKMYICNLVTQPGETDNFKVSDHIKVLNSYLKENGINVVIANDAPMSKELVAKYATEEQKDPVVFDKETLESMGIDIIGDKIYMVEDGYLRHDSLKTAYLIFSYLMNEK